MIRICLLMGLLWYAALQALFAGEDPYQACERTMSRSTCIYELR